MLFYERREKEPLKLLVKAEQKADEEAKEECIDVDFQGCVIDSDVPNRIFERVLEDNRKFGFENEIYSSEFFDFVLGL